MVGRRLRPHCSQALTATARQCAAFDSAWAGIETHHAALAQDRNDARNPEFRGFLHDEIHAIAARYALHERDGERRLAIDFPAFADRRRHPRAAHVLDGAGELATVAGE